MARHKRSKRRRKEGKVEEEERRICACVRARVLVYACRKFYGREHDSVGRTVEEEGKQWSHVFEMRERAYKLTKGKQRAQRAKRKTLETNISTLGEHDSLSLEF